MALESRFPVVDARAGNPPTATRLPVARLAPAAGRETAAGCLGGIVTLAAPAVATRARVVQAEVIEVDIGISLDSGCRGWAVRRLRRWRVPREVGRRDSSLTGIGNETRQNLGYLRFDTQRIHASRSSLPTHGVRHRVRISVDTNEPAPLPIRILRRLGSASSRPCRRQPGEASDQYRVAESPGVAR